MRNGHVAQRESRRSAGRDRIPYNAPVACRSPSPLRHRPHSQSDISDQHHHRSPPSVPTRFERQARWDSHRCSLPSRGVELLFAQKTWPLGFGRADAAPLPLVAGGPAAWSHTPVSSCETALVEPPGGTPARRKPARGHSQGRPPRERCSDGKSEDAKFPAAQAPENRIRFPDFGSGTCDAPELAASREHATSGSRAGAS